ncbi:hypothetical protein [Saccharopolyspora sp. NPDC050642]|uniref:hypothetical protein n=1 Tax=Saccharopolyspora sp. NPDC050642 TaxID=3157099 RepID=UPI0033EDAD70
MSTFPPTGWVACFKVDGERVIRRDVQRFSDDGVALVVDPERGTLVPAPSRAGFLFLEEEAAALGVVQSPPGWHVTGKNADGSTFAEPVVAWVVDTNGTGLPIVANDSETLLLKTAEGNFQEKLRRPHQQDALEDDQENTAI